RRTLTRLVSMLILVSYQAGASIRVRGHRGAGRRKFSLDAGIASRDRYGSTTRRFSDQHGGGNARHASADPAEVRAAGARSAVADDREHAAVLPGGARAATADQTPGRRARNQPRGGPAPAFDRRGHAAHTPADGRGRAEHRRRPAAAAER